MNGLFFGPYKIGKTHLLGTAAFDERTAPMALIDFEGGVLDVLEDMPGFGTDLVHIPVKTWDDFNEAYARIEENDEGFKSTGIDSIAETHIFSLLNILDEEKDKREQKGENTDLIQQGDYGTALVQLRRLVRAFRDLPIHAFFTAHSKEEIVTKEGMVKMPSMAGKASTEIPGLMTLVGYLTMEEGEERGKRVLLLNPEAYPRIRIGARAGWGVQVPDEIEDPTITAILDAFNY
jgi:hypothetical protein